MGKERRELEQIVSTLGSVGSGLRDSSELFEMAREENATTLLLSVDTDSKS